MEICQTCCTILKNISVKIEGHQILENINLHLHCGELTAIIGPNGAGKTTLFLSILGEIPFTGEVQHLHCGSKKARPPRIGYVPQKNDIDPLSLVTVEDFLTASFSRHPLLLGFFSHTKKQCLEALSKVEAQHLLHKRLSQLSGGELQRVFLALALTPQPELLLLDEPISGIDEQGSRQFYELLNQLKKENDLAILMVSHDLKQVVRSSDRIIVMNRKILFDGSPAQYRDYLPPANPLSTINHHAGSN